MTKQVVKVLVKLNEWIYSQLLRCNTARGSNTGLLTVGPTNTIELTLHTSCYWVLNSLCVRRKTKQRKTFEEKDRARETTRKETNRKTKGAFDFCNIKTYNERKEEGCWFVCHFNFFPGLNVIFLKGIVKTMRA